MQSIATTLLNVGVYWQLGLYAAAVQAANYAAATLTASWVMHGVFVVFRVSRVWVFMRVIRVPKKPTLTASWVTRTACCRPSPHAGCCAKLLPGSWT